MNMIFNKTSRLLVYVSLISLISVCTVFAAIPAEVVLGRSTIMTLKSPVIRVTLASPDIADVLLISPRQFQINGLKIGKTSLILWEEGNEKPNFYDLEVKGDQATIEQQMKELAPKDNITVKFAADTVILSGTVARDQTKTKAEEIAKAFAPKVLNHIQMAEPLQVLLQVKVAQVDRTALKKLGISAVVKGNSADGFGGANGIVPSGFIGDAQGSTTASTVSSALTGLPVSSAVQLGFSYFKGGVGATLQALATRGYGKILAEPNLLVKSQPPIKTGTKVAGGTTTGAAQTCSGDEGFACFLAGKQYPVYTIDKDGNKVLTFKDVGVKLVFHAEVLENGLINLRIMPASVSAVIGTTGADNQPILDVREVHTEVELGDEQSLVLAGLLSEEAIKTMSKIPLLGDIPFLGALFRSTSDDISEKELVFFVTPKIIKKAAKDAGGGSKFIAKEGEKYELPGSKLPIGMTESDLKIAPDQEKDIKWMPLGKSAEKPSAGVKEGDVKVAPDPGKDIK